LSSDGTYQLSITGSTIANSTSVVNNQWQANGTYSLYFNSSTTQPCLSSTTATGTTTSGPGGTEVKLFVTVAGDSTGLNQTRVIFAISQATGINPALITISSVTQISRRSSQYLITVSVRHRPIRIKQPCKASLKPTVPPTTLSSPCQDFPCNPSPYKHRRQRVLQP